MMLHRWIFVCYLLLDLARADRAAMLAEVDTVLASFRSSRCHQFTPIYAWTPAPKAVIRTVHGPESVRMNFGDELNLVLWPELLNTTSWSITFKNAEDPFLLGTRKLLAIGSILSLASQPGDVVFGAGFPYPWGSAVFRGCVAGNLSTCKRGRLSKRALSSPETRLAAVRGPLTAAILQQNGIAAPSVFGDPALLLPVLPSLRGLRAVGGGGLCVVPHLADERLLNEAIAFARATPAVQIIRMWGRGGAAGVRAVLERLVTCDLVVATALYAIIAADAFRVPAVSLVNASLMGPMERPEANRTLSAHDWSRRSGDYLFKFRDYFAGIGKPVARTVASLGAAKALADSRAVPPRLSTAELHAIAVRLLRAFPYQSVCRDCRSDGPTWDLLSPVVAKLRLPPVRTRRAPRVPAAGCPASDRPPSALVGVVASSTKVVRAIAKGNLQFMHARRDALQTQWVYFVHDDKVSDWWDVKTLAKRLNMTVSVRAGSSVGSPVSAPAGPGKRRYRPKHAFLRTLVQWLEARHDLVWMLDDDVSFMDFRLQAFLEVHRCAVAGGPPLLAQPTIRVHPAAESKAPQDFWHVEAAAYDRIGAAKAAGMLLTKFVEQQAPLYDALLSVSHGARYRAAPFRRAGPGG